MQKYKISDIFDFEKGSLQSSKNIAGTFDFITASSEWKTHEIYTHDCEAIIVAVAASGSLGRTHYVNGKFISSDLCFILQPKDKLKGKINLKFYHLYFNFIREDLVYKTSTGSAKKAINQYNFANYEIIMPDISYQNEIIDKLNIINENSNEFTDNNKENENLIKQLRQAILQEAVQGKLVPQDPNEEPASELLKKINAEKEKLIKEGKVKKEKPLPPIAESEIPYDLPQGWEWVRLIDLSENIHYGYNGSANFNVNEPKLLRITDIQNNKVNWETVPGCDIAENNIEAYKLQNNDILIARTGGTIGKSYLVENLKNVAIFASYLIRAIPCKNTNQTFIKLFIESPLYWKQLIDMSSGTGQPNVSGSSLKSLIVPLPPLEEQKRIVQKVDELMALCDALETQINQSKTHSEQLMQSILQEAFNAEPVGDLAGV